jgi:hypothetical protein
MCWKMPHFYWHWENGTCKCVPDKHTSRAAYQVHIDYFCINKYFLWFGASLGNSCRNNFNCVNTAATHYFHNPSTNTWYEVLTFPLVKALDVTFLALYVAPKNYGVRDHEMWLQWNSVDLPLGTTTPTSQFTIHCPAISCVLNSISESPLKLFERLINWMNNYLQLY